MEDFLRSCVERYRELTGVTTLRKACTPFLNEPARPDFSNAADDPVDDKMFEDAHSALQSVIDGTAGSTQDGGQCPEAANSDPNVPTQLAPYAAKVLMNILYAARYARLDLLRAVCVLAQCVTKWDRTCDLKLYRLICYINGSLKVRMTGWIGDTAQNLAPHLFADADFAGCSKTSRSTSGVHLSLLGPNSVWPLNGQSKKQGCVSHSTPEAELVAADHAVRTVGIPALDLWSILLRKPELSIMLHEDNETAIVASRQGWPSAMRHLERTHGVCLRSLAENFKKPYFDLMYERSALQSADIYTKAFTDAVEWTRAQQLVNHLDPQLFWGERPQGGAGPLPSEHKGGVRYDYWTSNPWQPQGEAPQAGSSAAVAAMREASDIDSIWNTFDEHDFFDDIVLDDTGYAESEEEEHRAEVP